MILRILSLSLLSVALTTIAAAAPQTITGVISDEMCRQKHGTEALAILIKRLHPDGDVVGLDPGPKALARGRRKAE